MLTHAQPAPPVPACTFCALTVKAPEGDRIGTVMVLLDNYPVTHGHTLVLPIIHRIDYFSMTKAERYDADRAFFVLRDHLIANDPTITGFNIGWNCGHSAGQTIMHAHGHLIPRRVGDQKNPLGGVRGVIPDKQAY